MKNQQSRWPRKVVRFDQLVLDKENPRLPREVRIQADDSVILDYLLRRESVMQIAQSISSKGYHQSATSIVYPRGKNYIVLDGNRRLAACQILANPKIIANHRDRKRATKLKEEMPAGALNEICISVAPGRKAANKEIWDIHVSKLAKPWQVLQQLRVYSNLIDTGNMTVKEAADEYNETVFKFKQELARLYFCEKIIESTNLGDDEAALKPLFNKITRVMLSVDGRELLGYDIDSVDDNGVVNFNDKAAAEAKIEKLIPYMLEPGRIQAQISKEELRESIYSEIDPVLFPPPIVDKNKKERAGSKTNRSRSWSSAKSKWITNDEYKEFDGGDRAKELLQELRKNKPTKGKNLNMVAVSMRVLVELAIYESLRAVGAIAKMTQEKRRAIDESNKKRAKAQKPGVIMPNNWSPTLREMLKYMSKEDSSLVNDQQQRKLLERFANRSDSLGKFLDDMDGFVHNAAYRPTDEQVLNLWDSFCRPIFEIIREINPKKINKP